MPWCDSSQTYTRAVRPEPSPADLSPNDGSRRKVVFEEGPQQPALWEVWTEGPRSCGKTVFWFFHSSGTFHNAFADQFSFTLLAKLADLKKKRPRCAPRAATWFHNATRSRS